MDISYAKLVTIAKRVLAQESDAIKALGNLIDYHFAEACELILRCKGRVIVTGLGKSGHIAQKIAASLTSTGTAAHFMHAAESMHGDLGVIHRDDLLLAISFSGETEEILDLLAPVKHLGAPVVAITGNAESKLAKEADVVLWLSRAGEADPHNLVPTTSTTLTLALGDAITIALMEARKFTPEDFAVFHPRGMLGKRLTLHVRDLLRGDETNPVIHEDASFGEALETMTSFLLGGVSVVDDKGKLAGIVTDGDVRRIIQRFVVKGGSVAEALSTPVSAVMTQNPSFIESTCLAYDALKLMENHKPRPIYLLPVVDHIQQPVGLLHIHALVQAGFTSRANDE